MWLTYLISEIFQLHIQNKEWQITYQSRWENPRVEYERFEDLWPMCLQGMVLWHPYRDEGHKLWSGNDFESMNELDLEKLCSQTCYMVPIWDSHYVQNLFWKSMLYISPNIYGCFVLECFPSIFWYITTYLNQW